MSFFQSVTCGYSIGGEGDVVVVVVVVVRRVISGDGRTLGGCFRGLAIAFEERGGLEGAAEAGGTRSG